jgi:ribosome-binding protein aMBF1 (putative translation factor)
MRRVDVRRLQLGMSKRELAAKLETTDDAVRAWLTGRTVARAETIARIKAFLGLT